MELLKLQSNRLITKKKIFTESYGLDILNQRPNEDGWISGLKCPFHEDKSPSAGYNVYSDILHCFSEGKSWKMGVQSGLDISTKLRLVLQMLDTTDKSIVEKEYTLFYNKGEIPEQILNRGFSADDFIPYDGGSDVAGNLVIPVKNKSGMVVGYVTRFTDGGSKRYLYNSGLRTGNYVFGIDLLVNKQLDYLYVTEGSLNTIWLNKFGYPSVSLLGSAVSNAKINLIKQVSFNHLVVLVDNDSEGIKVFNNLKRGFRNFNVSISYVLVPHIYSDIQDVRDETLLRQVLGNKRLDN